MFGQIKYSYIPKSNTTEAILSSFTHAYKAVNGIMSDYRLIDNIESGIRMYPEELASNVIKLPKEKLYSEIENLIKDDVDLIILNGFDISLDEIREKYSALVEESGIYLCINIFSDISEENNISINIDSAIIDVEEDEWEKIKIQITDSMDKATNDDESDKFKPKNPLKDLLDLFKNDSLTEKRDLGINIPEDLDIVELFSHQTTESELFISYNTDDSITIECNGDSIDISNKHFKFLLQSIESIKNIREK